MRSEAFGFSRKLFPLKFRGHNLLLVDNEGTYTVDERLTFHVTLYCSQCRDEQTIRGRLPPEQSAERKMALVKVAALGAFRDACPESNRKTYYSSSHMP